MGDPDIMEKNMQTISGSGFRDITPVMDNETE